MTIEDILRLSVPERLQLVEAIRDSIEADSDALLLTEDQRRELDRRLCSYESGQSETIAWEEVREDLDPQG